MKSAQGILTALLMFGIASSAVAQDQTTQGQPAIQPAVAFPPTPTPAPKEAPMDQAALDLHLIPSQFLGRTSDVLTLVYNGFRRSQVDPCGCVTHQLGGLPKEAKLIQRIDELKIPTLEVDAGGFVRDMPDEKMITQAKYVLKGLGKIGYDAVNVGFTDLAITPSELKKTASEAGLTLLSANIMDASGKPVFDPYTVKEVKLTNGSTLRVGIIGVTRPRVEVAGGGATQPSTISAGTDVASSETLTITDPIAAINKYKDEVGQKSDLVVVLDYDRRSNADPIIKGIKDEKGTVDVLVMGENSQIQGTVQAMDNIQVVSGGYEGRQLGTLYLELKDNKVASTWNKHIEVVQTIPSVPEIEKLVEEAHEATKAATPGMTSPTTGPTPSAPTKLNLGTK